ncbi:MAG: HalOD1 output domain-containing protein [Haloarculaceae archaeon]
MESSQRSDTDWIVREQPGGPGRQFRIAPDATASEAVVTAVARESDCDPLELSPLFETIDPDALDQLAGAADVGVTIRYEGFDVQLDGGDSLSVQPVAVGSGA